MVCELPKFWCGGVGELISATTWLSVGGCGLGPSGVALTIFDSPLWGIYMENGGLQGLISCVFNIAGIAQLRYITHDEDPKQLQRNYESISNRWQKMIQSTLQNASSSQTQKQLIRIITKTSAQHYCHQKNPPGEALMKDPTKKSHPKKKNTNKNWWQKGLDCFLNFIYCRTHYENQPKIFVKTENLLEAIQKLRNKKQKTGVKYLPVQKSNKKTLVIDLEGTFVYSSRQKIQNYDFKLNFQAEETQIRMFSKIRPGARDFFHQIANLYEIVVFTNCGKEQANAILAQLCKPGQIKHRLYRESCLKLNQIYYLKEMQKLNRNQTKVVFVDCNVETGVLQPLNFHQISRYKGNSDDRQLEKLALFLSWLAEKQAVTPIFKNYEIYLEYAMQFQSSYYDREDSILENSYLHKSHNLPQRISITKAFSRFKEQKDAKVRTSISGQIFSKQEPLKIQLEVDENKDDLSESKVIPPPSLRGILTQVNIDRKQKSVEQELKGVKRELVRHSRRNSQVGLLTEKEKIAKVDHIDNSDSLMIKQSMVFRQQI